MAEAVFPARRLIQIILCVRWRIISPKRLSEQKLAGFQRVMLHGGHEWLQEQYVSPLTNHRTDEYGASMKNRARFIPRALSTCPIAFLTLSDRGT